MKRILQLAGLLAACSVVMDTTAVSAGEPAGIKLEAAPSAMTMNLSVGSQRIPLVSTAGFHVYDATLKRSVGLTPESMATSAAKIRFHSSAAGDVRLAADFEQRPADIIVRGEIENLQRDERGFIVDFRIPRLSAAAWFSNALDEQVRMAGSAEAEGSVYPIAAMCAPEGGVALAIPPAEPRIFGLVADQRGMAIRFYLGTSPRTRRFPNRASFVFIIYLIPPDGGFRAALARYYDFFPEYYAPRLPGHGLMMFQMADRVPPNVDQYGFDEVEPQWNRRVLLSAIARDDRHGIATFPYMIVGQREIKFLPVLPSNYEAAMRVYDGWEVAAHAGHALTKESAAAQGDIHLKQEVETSACRMSDGRLALVLRKTEWGGNSVSFKMNPNPDLFADAGRKSVGALALEVQERWLDEYPGYDGAFVDSLGANWPALLNYRADHFTYARYPLTFDPQGRVALQNVISHYEYLETLRTRMRARGRLILANGVYAYASRKAPKPGTERQQLDAQLAEYTSAITAPEHHRPGAKLGRFFCAALLDVASSEAGVHATLDRCQDVRVHLGRKQYALLNYRWDDGGRVADFINVSLCFGLFASNTTNFFTGVRYEDHPNGYLRDKPLLDWYVPLVRTLSRAGWEPVRHATISDGAVAGERFGSGEMVYYTLYNNSTVRRNCTLAIDLAALGYDEANVRYAEIARRSELGAPRNGTIALSLEPKKTYVIQLSRIREPAGTPR